MSENFVEIKGLPELLKKLNDPEWVRTPSERFFDRWRFATQRKTVANFRRGPGGWIDTGGTRQSIASDRDSGPMPQWARVGSNKDAARWGEYGTGLLSEDPESAHRRYFPPPKALDKWAAKKKIPRRDGKGILTGRDIAFGIWKKGGTEPRRFLRNAAQDTEKDVPKYLGMMAKEIEQEAARGA